jgi:hypothetical protein
LPQARTPRCLPEKELLLLMLLLLLLLLLLLQAVPVT